MSRSGPTNFDSDNAFDYFSEIAGQIEREIEYWVLPEKVYREGSWLAKVLTVIEIMLLLEQNDIGHSVYIEHETAVQRWHSVFMPVWDSQWEADTNYSIALDDYTYRQQHRPAIEAMFNRLESIAHFWASSPTPSNQPPLAPLLPEYPLPYFTIRKEKPYNKKVVGAERFLDDFITNLVKEIIYWFSPEKRGESLIFNVAGEEIPAAAEVLAFICEMYEQDLGVNEQTVRNWRDITLQRIREFDNDMTVSWDLDDERLKIIKATFDRLEAVAHKYPPDSLYDFDTSIP